jgi:pimeloyl-ACP methyl ester carboxylesterase
MAHRVLLLPGSVLPADLAYGALVDVLGDRVDALVKDLEVYRDATPPDDYSLDTEVEGALRAAHARGWESFHLVGYSGGGASALAFAAKHGDRLDSLALLEPAWAGDWEWSAEHRALFQSYDGLLPLPPEEFMSRFRALSVRDGVAPPSPPPGPPPPWMALRPEGIKAFIRTFQTYDLSRASLAAFARPVYFALGALSNVAEYGEIADRLARVFPDFTLEVFDERQHFDPPHRIEPERLAASLLKVWDRAAAGSP